MNNAVSHSKGEWLMRMDGDDIMHPDRVRLTAEAISKYPQATAVCGRYQHFSHNIQPLTNPELHNLQYEVHNYKHFTELTKPEALEWWGGIMCMKRSIFDTFGPMPHDCDVLDDTMFATRALMLGDFVSMTNAILIYYRRHDNNVSSTPSHSNSIKAYLKADSEMRDYYRRGIHCHTPILQEVQQYTDKHPECKTLLLYFENRFKELSRQGNFWRKSWSERIADAHIQGPFWRKIPWAIRVFSPFTYALAAKFMKKS